MATEFRAGAVLYSRDPTLLQAFYQEVLGLDVEHSELDHVVLASSAFQLVIVRATPATAPERDRVAVRREDAAIKLAFGVPSIAAARALAPARGGEFLPPDREWDFQGDRVCDGQDPEGNVIQLRQHPR